MYVSQFNMISDNALDKDRVWIYQVIYKNVLHVNVLPTIGLIVIDYIKVIHTNLFCDTFIKVWLSDLVVQLREYKCLVVNIWW